MVVGHWRLCIVTLFVAASTATADAEDWSQFQACADEHMPAVERAEPSLHDGARLIVDVLCNDEAADLGNQMTAAPDRRGIVQERGFAGAFETFLSVMRRETTANLYEVRKRRLGL